ncbi:hypothetical protein IT418_02755 [bacterium]|nr:hypothetical protein [bacterium]
MNWLLLIFLFSTISSVSAAETINVSVYEDTYIEEKFPTLSPWSNRVLFLGTDSWYGKGKNRILMKGLKFTARERYPLYRYRKGRTLYDTT